MAKSREAERRQRAEGSLFLRGEGEIDVRREERDEERQPGIERRPLALKREKDDEAKKGQK